MVVVVGGAVVTLVVTVVVAAGVVTGGTVVVVEVAGAEVVPGRVWSGLKLGWPTGTLPPRATGSQHPHAVSP